MAGALAAPVAVLMVRWQSSCCWFICTIKYRWSGGGGLLLVVVVAAVVPVVVVIKKS
jgi:hypothetical protein